MVGLVTHTHTLVKGNMVFVACYIYIYIYTHTLRKLVVSEKPTRE